MTASDDAAGDGAAGDDVRTGRRARRAPRWRIIALVVAVMVVGGVAGVRWQHQRSHLHWMKADSVCVAVSPNRKVIGLFQAKYYSGSCMRMRTTLKKHDTTWVVGFEVAKTQDFCTAELGISQYVDWVGRSSVPRRKTIPDDVEGDPGLVVIHLDTPVPEDVTVVRR
jgi:hypothetical protein